MKIYSGPIDEFGSFCEERAEYIRGVAQELGVTASEAELFLKKNPDLDLDKILNSLIDKGLIEVSKNKKGETVYGLSEDGQKLKKEIS